MLLLCSVEQWCFDDKGHLLRRFMVVKLSAYDTSHQVALFDRQAQDLKDLSWKDEKGYCRSEAFAPTFFDVLRDPQGATDRKGRLFMRYLIMSICNVHLLLVLSTCTSS